MTSLIIIAVALVVVCYAAVERPGLAIAYVLFAQELNSNIFQDANLFEYRYAVPLLGLVGVHICHVRRQQFNVNVRNLFQFSMLQGVLIFTAYVVVYTVSIGGSYEIEYLAMFMVPGVAMCLIGAVVIYRADMLRDVVTGFVLFTAITMLYVQFAAVPVDMEFASIDRGSLGEETGISAITQGRLAGSLALACILTALMKRDPWIVSAMLALFGAAVAWMGMVGTRGALVSFLVGIFLYLAVSHSKSKSVRRLALVVLVMTPIAISSGIMETLLFERTEELFEPEGLESMRRVDRLYVFAEQVFHNFIIGLGPGGWDKYLWEGADVRRYPHNLFIEVQLEYGIIGLMMVLFIVFNGLRVTVRMCSDSRAASELKIISMLWVYYLVSTMFSGSLIQGNVLLFALTGLLAASYYWYMNDKKRSRYLAAVVNGRGPAPDRWPECAVKR